MMVTEYPGFYGMTGDIRLDPLHTFVDHDYYLILDDETLQQASFFKRCDNLKAFALSVRHPEAFFWANERTLDGNTYRHPKGYLRKLEQLELLVDTTMVKVDDEMIAFGPSLQHLKVTDVNGDEQPIPKTSVPRLSAYRCHQSLNSTGSAGGRLSDLTIFKWRDHWNLMRLTSLDLDGPPSSVFCFKWLKNCPSLATIQLTIQDGYQRLPLSSSSRNAAIPPITPIHPQPGTNAENADDTELDTGVAPLVESRLQSITLHGPWVMSEYDLAKVLTVYVPNLASLSVDRIHAVSDRNETHWHGKQFLKTVVDAVGLGYSSGQGQKGKEIGGSTSISGFQPGSKLKSIISAYNVDNSQDLLDLGLVSVPKAHLDRYRKRRVRLCVFVRFCPCLAGRLS
ncbi:hypothetical protein BGZ82_001528 [Podila clonocystis]|nr:hypothetical protein BGZ82_001528 [Podila clonocystis]